MTHAKYQSISHKKKIVGLEAKLAYCIPMRISACEFPLKLQIEILLDSALVLISEHLKRSSAPLSIKCWAVSGNNPS